jgi:type 1 glutamine amidotransferase
MKNILLITDGIFHPPLPGRVTLHRIIRQMSGFSFEHIHSMEQLPANLDRFSALVLHFHHKRISPLALARLDAFVKNGGGILAIHATTASFKQTLPYFDILGGRFIGHGPVEKFEVRQVKDEIFGATGAFVVRDELYLHELKPGIEVHFTAMHAGQEVPVVWTLQYGEGKVCYAVPGHTSGTMSNPAYQTILRRGLEWVCTP